MDDLQGRMAYVRFPRWIETGAVFAGAALAAALRLRLRRIVEQLDASGYYECDDSCGFDGD
jgi:hypothetical protein